jgi:hypothetical protein
MDHLLNLHAVAKAVQTNGKKVGVLYNKINSTMKGAHGLLDKSDITALERVLKEDHKKVLEHLAAVKKSAAPAKKAATKK